MVEVFVVIVMVLGECRPPSGSDVLGLPVYPALWCRRPHAYSCFGPAISPRAIFQITNFMGYL